MNVADEPLAAAGADDAMAGERRGEMGRMRQLGGDELRPRKEG